MQQFVLSRRKFIESTGIFATGLWLAPKLLFNFQESPVITIRRAAATAKIEVTKLRGNISVLEGSGGNISVLTGPEGKLMVDAGIDTSKANLITALDSLGQGKLKYLINSHWHFDHTDGNEWLHNEGATIIAHENTLKNLSQTIRVDDWDFTFPPAPKGALPTISFKKNHHLKFNGENLDIMYYPPAHTNSDVAIFYNKANILHVADTWWNGYYPFIDYSTGGNIKGMINATAFNISKADKNTIIIPGHGPIGDKKQLMEYHEMLTDIYSKVSELKKQGKSLNEVIAQKPTAKYDAKWGGFVIGPDMFTKLVYKGV